MSVHNSALEKTIDMGFSPDLVPCGTHICYLYHDEVERQELIAKYLNAGLENNNLVGYFANLDNAESVEDYLREIGVNLPDEKPYIDLILKSAKEAYFPDNYFDPKMMITQLKQLHHHACTQGKQCLRTNGDMTWALREEVIGRDRLIEYEARINLAMETHPFVGMCQYDTNKFDGQTIFEVLKVHPMLVVHGQMVHNPYYVPAREYLSHHRIEIDDED